MGNVIPFRGMDTLRSVVAGLGDPGRDKLASAVYGFQCLDDLELANIYRSNWIGRKVVDIPAMDAVRKGRDWQATKDQIGLIEAEEKRLGFWNKLLEAKTKARLWGGAALFIGTGDSDLTQPLNVERIGKGGVRYLAVLTRRDVAAGEIERDIASEFYGKPAYYEVTGASNTTLVRVHPSRLAVFLGAPHADETFGLGANFGWGDSVLDVVYTAMRNADATAANIASLVFEANVDVFGIPDFMDSLADPAYAKRLMERFTLAATAKGINRALLLDKDETYDRKQVNFATLPEVMQGFLQMVAGAADIPVTRLLGQSPAGMNATGESDMNNYYDRISSMQALEMTPALHRLDECLIRSATGTRDPAIYYEWAPLEQMSEKERAEIFATTAGAARTLFGSTAGQEMVPRQALSEALVNRLIEDGVLPGLDAAMGKYRDGKGPETPPAEPAIPPSVLPTSGESG